MTITKQDINVIVNNVNAIGDEWCVYEHYMQTGLPGTPPELIYIATCNLSDVFEMREARNNSDWCDLAALNPGVLIRIVMTTQDQTEAFNAAVRHMRSFPAMPRCNVHGYNVFGSNRAILASDGREFASQAEAARALGCSQAAISLHMNRKLDHVKGIKLTYKTKDAR